ncbi:hypothetical protein Tco_1178313 [Tanacetum coccineum]
MENANPSPSNHPVLIAALRARAVQELHELQIISAFVDSRLESIEHFLNNFANHPNETDMNNLESDDESVVTPLVSPFPHSDNDSGDGEVLNELIEYENVGMLRHEKAINNIDGDDLAFQCRKAHLLEDKQIPSVGVFDEAYLEKKRTRLQACTNIHQEVLFSESGDGVARIKRRYRDLSGDGVWILAMTSKRS